MKTYCILITGFALYGHCLAQNSAAILYDQPDCQGNQIDASDQPQDLSKQNFDKKAVSARLFGVWLFYEDIYYDFEGTLPSEGIYGTNNRCVNLQHLNGKVSSVRYAGSYNGFMVESLTVYPWTRFRGLSINSETEAFAYLGAEGVIVTGNSDWSVFDRNGNSACLVVQNSPAYLDELPSKIPHLVGQYHTFKKGCQGETRVPLVSIQEGTSF